MSKVIPQRAVSILDETRSKLEHSLDIDGESTSSLSEVTRLICLNQTFAAICNLELDSSHLFFRELSHTGIRNSVDEKATMDLIRSYLDSGHVLSIPELRGMDILDLTDTLGLIHSIGAHALPPKGYSEKRLHGAFYTPSHVARFIAQQTTLPYIEGKLGIKEIRDLTILDPCCGPGVFPIAACKIISESLGHRTNVQDVTADLAENIFGVDLDPGALEIASVCLSRMTGDASYRRHRDQFHSGNALINRGSIGERYFSDPQARMPFDWHGEFTDILDEGGFDIILFNPPYNRLKPNLAEFIRSNLRSGSSEVKTSEYEEYTKILKEDLQYIRNSGEYSYSISNSVNTYHLFIERSLKLAKEGGQIGFIVPSTLLADYSSRRLRHHLLMDNSVISFSEFPESARLFSGVTQSLCIGHVQKGGSTNKLGVRMGLRSLEEAYENGLYDLKVTDIEHSFGPLMVIPRINQSEWKILRRMHRHPFILTYSWIRNHRGELDLTLDKEYIREGKGSFPLVRGSAIGRYHLCVDESEITEHVEVEDFVLSRSNSERIGHINTRRIACQQISNQANRWRLKFSRIHPGTVLANSCNYIALRTGVDESLLDYLLGILNSETMNWRFAISSSNNHVSNHEISLLPIPDPTFPENRELVDTIVQLTRGVASSRKDVLPFLEAAVLSIYNIPNKDAHRLLEQRGLDSRLIREILEGLSNPVS